MSPSTNANHPRPSNNYSRRYRCDRASMAAVWLLRGNQLNIRSYDRAFHTRGTFGFQPACRLLFQKPCSGHRNSRKLAFTARKTKRMERRIGSWAAHKLLRLHSPTDDKRINLFGLAGEKPIAWLNHYSTKSVTKFMVKRERGVPNRRLW